MNIRFRKRVRLARGVYLNVGKNGVNSLSIGGPWLTLNIGRGGVYLSGSIVGSGLGFRTRLDKPASKKQGVIANNVEEAKHD